MNAPAPAAVLQQNIALDLLFPSPTNPRKRFNQVKLEELAASIKTQGVLQPILVRVALQGDGFGAVENKGNYEVIAGERRYRASKLAGLTEVPCFIRNLTDLQVLHAQVIENLQRDDLHPIEEAEGYENLMQQMDENGNKYTADTIAAEVGKSRGYVYGRLKLLDLCQEARDAFFDGSLENSTGQIIARIPTHKLQLEALTRIVEDDMSFRQAKDWIQRRFMLDLATAPFEIKDASLLESAGACTECLKRTGNQPELFDDVSSKDICTDTACFAEKKTAHIAFAIKSAETNGDVVIRKEEAKKLIRYPYMIEQELSNSNLALLSDEIPDDAEERTWEDMLNAHGLLSGKKALHKTIIENPFQEEVLVAIDTKVAMAALTKAGFQLAEEQEPKQSQSNQKAYAEQEKKRAAEKAAEEAEATQKNAFRKRLFEVVRQKIAADFAQGIVAEGLYRVLANEVFTNCSASLDEAIELFQHHLPDFQIDEDAEPDDEGARFIDSLSAQQLFLFMLDCILISERSVPSRNLDTEPVRMLQAAKAVGIDAAAVEQEAIETKPTKKTSTKKGAK
jgi:ParB/RepB/Spo0J family partition protein